MRQVWKKLRLLGARRAAVSYRTSTACFSQTCSESIKNALLYMMYSLVPRLPPLARNYCVTFKLALEFKGHAIIARKGGSLGTRLHDVCVIYFCP